MSVERLDLADSHRNENPELQAGTPTAREVLEELFLLLEEYAPAWYTEEHHNRALAALLRRDV
jgi:hypothetical protein